MLNSSGFDGSAQIVAEAGMTKLPFLDNLLDKKLTCLTRSVEECKFIDVTVRFAISASSFPRVTA
jgi:hypothetical protein